MVKTPADFKRDLQERFKTDPSSFLKGIDQKDLPPNAKEFNVEFAPDEAIQSYLDGTMRPMGGVCCLAKVQVVGIGGYTCISPLGGDPDNMCLR